MTHTEILAIFTLAMTVISTGYIIGYINGSKNVQKTLREYINTTDEIIKSHQRELSLYYKAIDKNSIIPDEGHIVDYNEKYHPLIDPTGKEPLLDVNMP